MISTTSPTAMLSILNIADANTLVIAIVELAERFSYYGTTVVFTNFIQQKLPAGTPDDPGNHRTGAGGAHGQSGALGLGQRASTGITLFNTFYGSVIPLFGAYIADTYWGRYKTVCVAVSIAMVGHALLIVSAVPGIIERPPVALAWFLIALVVMATGTGGFKANISPLVAEQYKRTKLFIATTPSGERVVVDPALTTSRIYMYFYLFINIGSLVGQIVMAYSEKYVGFWLAYTLPTVVFFLCPLVLYAGRHRYTHAPPTGSVLANALRLWSFAARDRWTRNPLQLVKNMTRDDFWELAKPSRVRGILRPAWMTFDDQWVDEVRRGFKACTVFCWYPIYCRPALSI
jgi:proton-dependent oligopeptide transporter, POT family